MNVIFAFLLVVGLATAAPSNNPVDDKVIVTKEFYPDSFVKYRSQHDIVKIVVPINSLSFDGDNSSGPEEDDADITFFFVEADVAKDGKLTYQGLYIFKKNKATKLLDNGRDAAASADDSTKVFLGADDGIYVYKPEKNEAVKYGLVTDSIIAIEKTNTSDVIYILTEDHEVYKITDDGNTKNKVDEVVDAQQIVLDYMDNLYFYAQDKQPYVLTADGVKKIDGLPANPTKVDLIKAPFVLEDGVPIIIDNAAYIIYANGSSEITDFEFKPKAKPTAYGMEGTVIQYYAYNKNIYEYNLLVIILGGLLDELKSYFDDKTNDIQSLTSRRQSGRTKHD